MVQPDMTPDNIVQYENMPNFMRARKESNRRCALMNCFTVADLNNMTYSGKISELIQINEALHENHLSYIADLACRKNAKVIMLAGPSASGKTTSANRLGVQLRIHGKKPTLISLDDYYINREKIRPDKDGKLDFEHINTIDITLFQEQIRKLLSGDTICLPSFDFLSGIRKWRKDTLTLSECSVIIVEGLHALNPVLLPDSITDNIIFRVYVTPLLHLNLESNSRFPANLLRLMRRIARDYNTRGASVRQTMSMWDSVRRGERRWIFPYQESADVIFNSATLYELAVLKKHIYPLLLAAQPEDSCYEQIWILMEILNYIVEADVDAEIPPTSIVREFIGGNSFYQ